jgi:hypothetical protein
MCLVGTQANPIPILDDTKPYGGDQEKAQPSMKPDGQPEDDKFMEINA